MDKQEKIEAYFRKDSPWQAGVMQLRQILSTTALTEDWKWNFPTYTFNNKNVVAIASYKKHFGIWFFQGVFLKDEHKLLRNAQKGKTKAMRSLYFTSSDDLNDKIILQYVIEALQNCKDGKQLKITRDTIEVIIPQLLKNAFQENLELIQCFNRLSPSKQRDYAEHIGSAKQEVTKLRRLDKCIPKILEGIGLNDTYKKS